MVLQNILMPKTDICTQMQMYFKYTERKAYFNEQLQYFRLKKNAEICSRAYFNCFSYGKWRKYTFLDNLYISLRIKGHVLITVYNDIFVNGIINGKIILKKEISTANEEEVKLELDTDIYDGFICFSVSACNDEVIFKGGYYGTDLNESKCNEVNIALNMCTFRREQAVYHNVDILRKSIYENASEDLARHLYLFITDNGQTIDDEKVKDHWIYYIRQDDNGSAGGYTRGLIEILHQKVQDNITHVIMMDDDVMIEPESIRKNYIFLRMLKNRYKKAFIGGALLRSDYQNIQFINGQSWDASGEQRFYKCNYDLNNYDMVVRNEIEENASVNGWWYCCIPMTHIRKDNLPYPFFFHMDDIEYSLRNCRKLITLNGICVWHEPYEYKPSSYIKYYNVRNITITNTVYYREFEKKALYKYAFKSIFEQVKIYKYKDAELILMAFKDFLKGPEWLMALNPVQQIDELMDMSYKKKNLQDCDVRFNYGDYLYGEKYRESCLRRFIRMVTMNGHILPNKYGSTSVQMFAPKPESVFRVKKLLNYDEVTGKGYVTEKSAGKMFQYLFKYLCLWIKINVRFHNVRKRYIEKFPYMCTEEFWKSYLR